MAQKMKTRKNKKQAQGHPKEEADVDIKTVTWPDFPQTLVNIIAKQPALMQSVSYGGVAKLCISPPRKCCPNNPTPPCLQLEMNNNNYDEKYTEHILNLSFYRRWFWPWYFSSWSRKKAPVRGYGDQYVGYSNDAIVTKSAASLKLWYIVRGFSHSYLPEWDERIPLIRIVKSRKFSYDQGYTVMVLTGISHPAFLFYRASDVGEYEWEKQHCNLIEPHCSTKSERKHFMRFTNAIGFNGKFYVLSLQGTLAVIDNTDSSYPPRITAMSSERAVPSVQSKHFREYLLESEGNVLLVFLISRNSIKIVDDVEVFQLNTKELSWPPYS
ncbi:hypothetical protein COLO4_32419 [Corchorus olitorius]|uniref:KIB1-4 beta-propeller domain-containing protein n=1 Tax=Corchorus olitorius TaxID=93759 RepID=A0A1R3GZE5_9ROSI|nr:hypothetical protein COLO4_32419 [Corchorus olitorius]